MKEGGREIEQLLLQSGAGSDCNGARQTEVVNKQEEFLPPQPLLSAYLEQLS